MFTRFLLTFTLVLGIGTVGLFYREAVTTVTFFSDTLTARVSYFFNVREGVQDVKNVLTQSDGYSRDSNQSPAKMEEFSAEDDSRLTITFLGDVMLARSVAKWNAGKWSGMFTELPGSVMQNKDAVVANLEGVFMDTPEVLPPNTMRFQFPTSAIQALTSAGITHVSLANNHSDNGGKIGTSYTHTLLTTHGISWFGGYDVASPAYVGYIRSDSLDAVLIGVNLTYGPRAITDLIRLYSEDFQKKVIVFPHWGEEYADKANDSQRQLAHAWIDAGADLVIGAHTHSVQDAEIYKGVPIIYSLGNTVFDQTWSEETSEGLIVTAEMTQHDVSLEVLPIEIVDGRPRPARTESMLRTMERIGYVFPVVTE